MIIMTLCELKSFHPHGLYQLLVITCVIHYHTPGIPKESRTFCVLQRKGRCSLSVTLLLCELE